MDRGLIPCPYCSHDVIAGADHCDNCSQPLTDSHLPIPATLVERRLLADRLSIFKLRQPLCVSPTMPVRETLRLLVDNRVGCVLVVQQGKLVGIFTERDVLLKIGEQAESLGDRPISEFMTSPVQTLPTTAKIAFAVHRMDLGGYRHVPLVNEQEQCVGVVSVRDILGYLTGQMRSARQG
jgi:CBS domain-containing protein